MSQITPIHCLDVRFYLAQHEIYLKRLRRAIEKLDSFNHKECCKYTKENCCAFGQAFYRDVMPRIDSFPPQVKEVLLEIEEVHCRFHEIGKKIDTKNPDQALVKEMQDTSLNLYQLLMRLEKMLANL
ncbi:MAG: CZB domain-containing protein [Aquificaceae bacterium]|nr:CZB domain-containing protein [Aquificaceae bacterium]